MDYKNYVCAVGKRLPGAARGTSYGEKLSTAVKSKNPFQLTAATSTGAQQQETRNPFSSATHTSKPPPYAAPQSEQLFKPSGNELSTNPFVTSSASAFTTTTSGASLGGRSYAQALQTTGARSLKDPRLECSGPTFTTDKPNPDSNIEDVQSKQHGTSQNPFSGFKSIISQKRVGIQSKMQMGASRLHRPAPPTTTHHVITLSVRNVDQKICTPDILRNHFQQFGEVCDLKCMPRKGMATISYNDHVSMCLVVYTIFQYLYKLLYVFIIFMYFYRLLAVCNCHIYVFMYLLFVFVESCFKSQTARDHSRPKLSSDAHCTAEETTNFFITAR